MPLFNFKKKKKERIEYKLEIDDMKLIKMDRLINPNESDKTCNWQQNFSITDQIKIKRAAIKYLKRKLDEIQEFLFDGHTCFKQSEATKIKEKLEELKYKINETIKVLKRKRLKSHDKKTTVHDSHVNIGIDLAIIMLGSKIFCSDTLSAEYVPHAERIQLDRLPMQKLKTGEKSEDNSEDNSDSDIDQKEGRELKKKNETIAIYNGDIMETFYKSLKAHLHNPENPNPENLNPENIPTSSVADETDNTYELEVARNGLKEKLIIVKSNYEKMFKSNERASIMASIVDSKVEFARNSRKIEDIKLAIRYIDLVIARQNDNMRKRKLEQDQK